MAFIDTIAANLRWAYTGFGFRDRPATVPIKMAVAELRPTADDFRMALDISPGPNAVEHADAGLAWIDVMNHSTQEPEGAPSHSASIRTFDSHVEFGSRAWNGAGPRAVHLVVGSRTKVAIRLELDSAGNPLITCYGRVRATGFDIIPAGTQPPN